MSGSLRMYSWEEMCVPGGVMGIIITENKGVRGVREKFRGDARSRIELSVSDWRGVDIEKRGDRFWKLILTHR